MGVPTPKPESLRAPLVPSGAVEDDGPHCVFGLKRKISEMKALIASRKAAQPQARLPAGARDPQVKAVEKHASERAAVIKARMAHIESMMALLGSFSCLLVTEASSEATRKAHRQPGHAADAGCPDRALRGLCECAAGIVAL